MNNIKVYSKKIDDVLTTITLDSFKLPNIVSINNPSNPISTENNFSDKNKKAIGDAGEKIALKYLRNNYPARNTKKANNDSLGYDISSDNQCYEVKTTIKNQNKFEISRNELDKAIPYKTNLFFIKLSKETAIGFIIQDMINELDIKWDKIKYNKNDKVQITIEKIEISLESDYLRLQPYIDLTSYLPENWDKVWREFNRPSNV